MEFTCINCPMGCRLNVTEKDGKLIITGNSCKRGEDYGRQEYTSPMRVVTSLGRAQGHVFPLKTSKPIPKSMMNDVLVEISKINLNRPVKCGEVIIKNILGLDADIVATADSR
jgi:CxxC motif-containing protein